MFDFTEPGQRWIASKGGEGGRGNARFATSTRRVPRFAEEGKAGEERELILELKLLADVGLIGFPNTGKSTLISAISAATPKVADYPFTTLVPNLGVVKFRNAEPFIVADIPGLIEGAHEGKGLGIRFLRHIERTRVLVHVLDITTVIDEDPIPSIQHIDHELEAFNSKLLQRPQVVVLNKIDLVDQQETVERIKDKLKREGCDVFALSALKRQGLEEFLETVSSLVAKETEQDEIQPPGVIYQPL